MKPFSEANAMSFIPLVIIKDKIMFKFIAAFSAMGTGTLVAQAPATHGFVEYGAIGVLGACAIYVITKLVPLAIHSREKEVDAFLHTLTQEREKAFTAMDAKCALCRTEFLASHAESEKLIRELNEKAENERKVWAEVMKEANVIHARNYGILQEVVETLKTIRVDTTSIDSSTLSMDGKTKQR